MAKVSCVWALVVLVSCGAAMAAGSASFGGMTWVEPDEPLLDAIEASYGEPCGMLVTAVAEDSLAARTGIAAGDVVISVRLPEETDYYPMPSDLEEIADFCAQTQATDQMRLLLLRKEADKWAKIECMLGKPLGEEVPAGQLEGHEEDLEAHEAGSPTVDFIPDDPNKVLATTANGDPLVQRDADIFGALVEWAFKTRVTEGQRVVIAGSMVKYWQEAKPQDVQSFNQGIRSAPAMIQQMQPQWQEIMRVSFAESFLTMAQQDPEDPLSKLIMTVATQSHQVLAGEGTEDPFTQQDADALIEYISFQYLMSTGTQASFTEEQRKQLIAQAVKQYEEGTPEQKKQLARMDQTWAMVRVQWERAQAQQQQALAAQWQQAYQQQLQAAQAAQAAQGAVAPSMGVGGGHEMSDGTYNALLNAMNAEHAGSMSVLGSIDGTRDTDVFNNDGLYMYSY